MEERQLTEAQQQVRLSKLKAWRDQELSRQSANRYQMAKDEDYYDSLQLTPDEIATLLARGQAPTVYNEIAPTINWMLGTERRTRTDFKVAPMHPGEQPLKDAVVKTKIHKYLAEVNKTPFVRSHAFKDAIVAGLGWLESGVRQNPEQESIFLRNESWRYMLYDSLDNGYMLEESRYLYRMKWLDVDTASALFPKHESKIEIAAESNPGMRGYEWWYGRRITELDPEDEVGMPDSRHTYYDASAWLHNPRDRVQLFECWYRMPVRAGRDMTSTYDGVHMQMRCAIFTDMHLLYDAPSPYRHNRFPFIPVWCYRRARDNAPYGAVRSIRSPQDALNKRMSKSVFSMSVNRVTIERDAIDSEVMDERELREEFAAPDGFAVLARDGLKKVKVEQGADIAQGNLALAERDRMSIRQVAGVTSEQLGRDSNLVSGVALKAKHEEGSTVTTVPFDNLRLARQLHGEIELSLIEQFMNEPKVIRLTGERGRHEFEQVNTRDETTGEIINDITRLRAQFVIDEQDYRESLRQAIFEQLMDLMSKIAAVDPMFARNMLDLVIDNADIPGRDAIVRRIREITGMVDPDAEVTPEQQAQKQQQKQAADAVQQMDMEMARAKIDEMRSKVKKMDAETLAKVVEGFFNAMQAGTAVATNPAITPVADAVLQAAGFQPAGGVDPNIPAPAQAIPAQPIDPAGATGDLMGGELPPPTPFPQ
jgi:hypothetical protein